MNKILKHSILLFLFILLLGTTAISATESTDSSTIQQDIADDTIEVNTINKDNNIIIEQNQKTKKTNSKTVSNYAQLESALTATDENNIINLEKKTYTATKTIEIKSKINNITINGNGAVIDGQNKYQFISFVGSRNITINNLHIKNTKTTDGLAAISMSGPAQLTLNNVNFTNNIGNGKGGAIVNRGNLTVNNCVFTKDTAQLGGAIYSTGEYGGNIYISNSKFINNNASITNNHDRTAVIYAIAGGKFTVTNCIFDQNNGRAIHAFKDINSTINGNTFSNMNFKQTSGELRGIVIDKFESPMSIENNIFKNIKVQAPTISGGIIYNEIGNLNLENNTFNNVVVEVTNKTHDINGGILFNRNATTTVKHNVFNNTAIGQDVRGGALYNNIGNYTIILNQFNTIMNASRDIKGVIYNDIANNVKSNLTVGANTFNPKITSKTISNKTIFNIGNKIKDITDTLTPKITVKTPSSITTGLNAPINITVTDKEGKKINTSVIIKVNGLTQKDANGNNIIIKIVNGQGNYNLNLRGYSGRTHKITIVTSDNKLQRQEASANMNVVRGKYMLTPITFNASSEELIKLNKTIKDANGNIISGVTKVAVKVGDRTVLTTSITDGKLDIQFKVPYLPEGNNKFQITLGENYRYEMSRIQSTINIHKQNITATIDKITAKAGQIVTIKATLKNKDTKTNVISGKYSFKLDTVTTAKDLSNSTMIVNNGIAQIKCKIPNCFVEGLHNITLVYASNKQSNSARITEEALMIIA